MRRLIAVICIVILASACGTTPSPTPPPPSATGLPGAAPTNTLPPVVVPTATTPTAPTATGVPAPSPSIPGGSATMVELATADLAARLSIAATTINVKSVESVEWPDSSLGCPQPGQMYTQVITPGYRIILTAGGKDYDYHASRTKVVLCQS